MHPPRPCIVARCPAYNLTGGSRCPAHETKFEAERKAWTTGRRGTSASWRRIRSLALARDKGCVACGEEEDLAVHHVDEDARNDDLENLRTLCRPCHRAMHTGKGVS